MENKKCPDCGYEFADDTMEYCPVCSEKADAEASEVPEATADTEYSVITETEGETISEEPKANKKLKAVTIAVAAVMVLALGFLLWHILGVNNPKDMTLKDIEGTFVSHDNSNFFEFKAKKTKVEVPEGVAKDNSAASDASALSDAGKEQVNTKTVVFDGTFKNGYTLDYVQYVLANEYVIRNELQDEYQKYYKEKNLVLDDYVGFVKSKGVVQSKLDEIDKELQISVQRDAFDHTGYWTYNEKTKEFKIYSNDGSEVMATLIVSGDALVDPASFFAGDNSDKKRFNASFVHSEEGVNETLTFYKDGNFIVKAQYADSETEAPQYMAGTYNSDGKNISVDINGQKTPYIKVKGGITAFAFIKQK